MIYVAHRFGSGTSIFYDIDAKGNSYNGRAGLFITKKISKIGITYLMYKYTYHF